MKACMVRNIEENLITVKRESGNFLVVAHGFQTDLKAFDSASGVYTVQHGEAAVPGGVVTEDDRGKLQEWLKDVSYEGELAQVAHLAFIAAHYKPQFWWFEVVECGRRLLLSGGLVFVSPGSAAQGLYALVLSLGFVRLYSGCCQYPDAFENRVAEIAQWQLAMTFLAALLIRVDVSSNVSVYDERIFDVLLVIITFTGPAIAFLTPIMPYLMGQPLPDYKGASAKSFLQEQLDEQVAGLKPEGVDEFMGQLEEGLEKGGKSDAKRVGVAWCVGWDACAHSKIQA